MKIKEYCQISFFIKINVLKKYFSHIIAIYQFIKIEKTVTNIKISCFCVFYPIFFNLNV